MQRFIAKYALAAHLALLAVAPLFLSGVAVLWLAALAAFWIFLQPSLRGGEALHDARCRVARAVVRDPVTWISLAFALFAAIRWLNGGVKIAYDAEKAAWSLSTPSVLWLPGSADYAGFPEFVAAMALAVLLIGCRQALGKWARFCFFLMTSLLSGIGAIVLLAFTVLSPETHGVFVDCSLTNPMYVGSFFAVNFAASMVAYLAVFEGRWLRMVPLAFAGIVGNAAATFCFGPPWLAFLTACAFLPLVIYAPIYARKALGYTGDLQFVVSFFLAITMAACLVWATLPTKVLMARLEPWTTGAFLPENFAALRKALSDVSFRAWRDHNWLGTGLGSFPFCLNYYATDADWLVISSDQIAPLNGYWHFIVEQGIVGAIFMLVLLGQLLWAYCRDGVRYILNGWPHPACFSSLLILIALLVETAVDSSFWMPSTFVVALVYLIVSSKSFPKEKFNV